MSDVSVERIEALIQFRVQLIKFNRELAEDFATMEKRWRNLHDIWHDKMYERLGDAIGEVTPGIKKYLAETEKHEAYLRSLIERLRAVTEVR